MTARIRHIAPTAERYHHIAGGLVMQSPDLPGHWQPIYDLAISLPGWGLRDVFGGHWHSMPGRLLVADTYTFDGASGPALDDPAAVLAALVHDLVCEPTPDGYAIASYYRRHLLYYRIARRQGMHPARAAYHFIALLACNWAWGRWGKRRKGRDSADNPNPD